MAHLRHGADLMAGAQHAQMAGDGELPAAAISHVYSSSSNSAGSSRSFSSASFGAAATDRYLLIFAFSGGTARTLTALRAGGVDATILFQNSFFAVGLVPLPTGTSGTYYVEWDGSKASFGISVFRLTGLQTLTPTDGGFVAFSGLVASVGMTVHAGGVVAGYLYGGGSSSRTVTWANMTEANDAYIRTVATDGYAEMHSAASAAFADVQSTITISATLSGDLVDSKAAYIFSFR